MAWFRKDKHPTPLWEALVYKVREKEMRHGLFHLNLVMYEHDFLLLLVKKFVVRLYEDVP